MSITSEELARRLDVDEPEYELLAQLGAPIVPHLRTFVRTGSIALATKATSLAGFIGTPGALDVIEDAATHADPRVRIAAAGTIMHFQQVSSRLVVKLLRDVDPGVRVRTLKSVRANPSSEINVKVQELIATDPDESVRSAARELYRSDYSR